MAGVGDRLTVELEIVTPMFLGGAVPDEPPELRPPSVRGALRFWWRAWYLGQHPETGADDLLKAESTLFGGTGQTPMVPGRTAAASRVVVRLAGQPQQLRIQRPQLPAGLNYLFYGLHKPQKDTRGSTRLVYRPAWAPTKQVAERVTLTLSVQRRRDEDCRLGRGTLAALWLLCNLGGLGARTRRGAGAIHGELREGEWPDDMPGLDLRPESPPDLRRRLQSALNLLVGHPEGAPKMPTSTPTLHPSCTWIAVFPKDWPNWMSALEEVGEGFRAFRSRFRAEGDPPDSEAMRAFIDIGQKPATIKSAAFGLPLQFYFRSIPASAREGRTVAVTGYTSEGTELDRSASPLHFRVVPLTTGRVTVLVLAFVARLLPPESTLRLEWGTRTATPRVPDQSALARYFDDVRDQLGPWLEVRYG